LAAKLYVKPGGLAACVYGLFVGEELGGDTDLIVGGKSGTETL
jgi:hypothetical protein